MEKESRKIQLKRPPKEEPLWVAGLAAKIQPYLNRQKDQLDEEFALSIWDHHPLAYDYGFHFYEPDAAKKSSKLVQRNKPSFYETDLLIADHNIETNTWIPRVVIECKLTVRTHDSLTYSAKAAAHKQVHPQLRYGFLFANKEKSEALPMRLIKHGAYFDFMVAWSVKEPKKEEFERFVDLLAKEVRASRDLESLLFRRKPRYSLLHKRLVLES